MENVIFMNISCHHIHLKVLSCFLLSFMYISSILQYLVSMASMGCCTGAKPCVTVNSSLEVETLEEASCSLEPDEAEDEEVTLAPRPSPVPVRAAVTRHTALTRYQHICFPKIFYPIP